MLFRLEADFNFISADERIDGQHPQRWHTVNDDVIIMLSHSVNVPLQDGFPAHNIH